MGVGDESSTPQFGASWVVLALLRRNHATERSTTLEKSCTGGIHRVHHRLPPKVGTSEFTSRTGLCWWGLQSVMGGSRRRPSLKVLGICRWLVPAKDGGWQPPSLKESSGKHLRSS